MDFYPITPQANSQLMPLKGGVGTAQTADKKMRETAEGFESFFMFQVLELMQPKDLGKNNIMSGGFAEDMFRHNLNEEVAKMVTEQGGIGIADQIYGELLKYQEQSQ